MKIYKVTEKDLNGSIKDFPIEVVQKMVERQYEQTGNCDVKVFQKRKSSDADNGGFYWKATVEDHSFWDDVIFNKEFDMFFARYPKQQIQEQEEEDFWIKPEGVRMLVWDDDEKWAEEKIVIAKLPKNTALPYVCVSQHYEKQFEKGGQYHTAKYKNAKPFPLIKEITMQEIADKFEVSVDRLKIKKQCHQK